MTCKLHWSLFLFPLETWSFPHLASRSLFSSLCLPILLAIASESPSLVYFPLIYKCWNDHGLNTIWMQLNLKFMSLVFSFLWNPEMCFQLPDWHLLISPQRFLNMIFFYPQNFSSHVFFSISVNSISFIRLTRPQN